MTVKTEPFIGGKYGWDFGESGWNVGADENWLKLSYFHNPVYHGFESSDANAGAYPNGTSYWNSTDLTINPKVNGTTYKWSVFPGFVMHSADGSTKFQFTGSTLVRVMAPADWTKLNNIQPNATANLNDSWLMARENHTGQQPTTSVINLEPRLSAVETDKAPKASPTFTNDATIQGTVPVINIKDTNNTVTGIGGHILFLDSASSIASYIGHVDSNGELSLYNSTRNIRIKSNTVFDLGLKVASSSPTTYIQDLDSTKPTMFGKYSFQDSTGSEVGYLGYTVGNTLQISNGSDPISIGSVLTNTAGAKFGNVARTDTNTLDWYEEGTFLPTVRGNVVAGTGSYTSRSGSFTRIGNRVYFNIQLGWVGHSGTGIMGISGLPYNVAESTSYSVYYDGMVVASGKQLTACSIFASDDRIDLLACDPAGGGSVYINMDSSVSSLNISGNYRCL